MANDSDSTEPYTVFFNPHGNDLRHGFWLHVVAAQLVFAPRKVTLSWGLLVGNVLRDHQPKRLHQVRPLVKNELSKKSVGRRGRVHVRIGLTEHLWRLPSLQCPCHIPLPR